MDLLEKLGLARKTKGLAPIVSDNKGRDHEPFSLNDSIYIKVLIFILFLGFVILIFPRFNYKTASYQLGEPWRHEDLTAPFTFSLIKNKDELEQEKQQIIKQTSPIFYEDNHSQLLVDNHIDSLFEAIVPVLKQYAQWQNDKNAGNPASEQDSVQYRSLRNSIDIGLDDKGWNPLLQSYSHYYPKNSAETANKEYIGAIIHDKLKTLVDQVMRDGIVNWDKSDISNNELIVRNQKNSTERSYFLANVRDINGAKEYARYWLSRELPANAAISGAQLFGVVIQPNLMYNKDETEARINSALSSISPTEGAVAKGQVIIRKGDLIKAPQLNMLRSLAKARQERASKFEVWQQYIGEVLIIVGVVLVFFMYIYLYRKPIYDENSKFLLVFLAIALVIGATAFVVRFDNISAYVVPIAITPIILTIVFDSRVGLLTTITLSMLAGMMVGYDFEFMVATITASSMAVYSVRDIKNRSQFFLFTPGLIFATYVVILAGFTLSRLGDFSQLGDQFISVLINSVLIWLTYPLILLFEKLFKVTTDVTLLELSDTNQPLLKKLMMRAPGTFHHSLQVANLAEAAASEIGANALLCRVGSLYHDIGKTEKPEYFVENQSAGMNGHNKLKPRMSAIIIKSHVSTGVKMAEEANLPDVVTSFIRTHHGTSLIRFFYEKARENTDKSFEIQEEDFRYEGPIPTTKETGIVMLADGVEASCRSMTEPTYARIDNLVSNIIDQRLKEGQLNDCPLTFKDLQSIKQRFMNILVGMYHGRVKYPGQDEMEKSPDERADAKEKRGGKQKGQQPDKMKESGHSKDSKQTATPVNPIIISEDPQPRREKKSDE